MQAKRHVAEVRLSQLKCFWVIPETKWQTCNEPMGQAAERWGGWYSFQAGWKMACWEFSESNTNSQIHLAGFGHWCLLDTVRNRLMKQPAEEISPLKSVCIFGWVQLCTGFTAYRSRASETQTSTHSEAYCGELSPLLRGKSRRGLLQA